MTKEEAKEILKQTANNLIDGLESKDAAVYDLYDKAKEVIDQIDGIDRDALILDMDHQLMFRMNPGLKERVRVWIETYGRRIGV